MPELLMERPKMSLQMHETLKKYILRERRKKKEEDEISEQKIREEMKKVEMNTQSLEQNKTNLKQLEVKLDDLQLKRRELFNQLKKVLNEETTLKKNNRPPITLTPQAGSMPFICGPSQFSYQQLIASQLQSEQQQGLAFPPQSGHPPQLINQPTGGMPIPASKTPPNNSSILTPGVISSPSNGLHTPVHLNNPKSQSPFHPPQLLHHLGQGFPLIPPGSLKYGMSTSMSPQILTAHQHASPSSSPRHHQMPANSINTPNSKRPRSPSPHTSSASPHNSNISPFVFNQGQHTPSRSPATHPNNSVAQSPPPNLREQIFSNSPSANKKTRTNLMHPSSSSPSLNTHTDRQQQQNRQNPQPNNFIQSGGLTPQQQSAFSAYHHSLITGRPGPLNPSFQSHQTSQQQQQQQQQQQHNKSNKSPNLQTFQSQPNPQSFLQRGTGNLQPPSLPPPSHSPLNFNTMTSHYLNQLAKEATNKIFQQQAQQQQQQQSLQQHLMHQQQIQMLSAAAAAAAAAATHHQSQNESGRFANAAASGTGSGGGSILTGYARSASNPSQQRPPSNY